MRDGAFTAVLLTLALLAGCGASAPEPARPSVPTGIPLALSGPDVTVSQWCRALESNGWAFEKDEVVRADALAFRYILYHQRLSAIRLDASIVSMATGDLPLNVMFAACAPQDTKALREAALCSLVDALIVVGPDVRFAAREAVGRITVDSGLPDSIGSQWEVKFYDYANFRRGGETVLCFLMISRVEVEPY